MADIAEVSNFDTNVYLLDINDPATGGLTGNANKQAIALANRTRWLYDNLVPFLGKLFLSVTNNTPIVIASGSNAYARTGGAHVVPVVIASDFTTPNDGITRTYRVTLHCLVSGTANPAGHFHADLLDFSNNVLGGPIVFAGVNHRDVFATVVFSKIVSIPPNKPLIWVLSNVGTGANMTIQDIQYSFEQL